MAKYKDGTKDKGMRLYIVNKAINFIYRVSKNCSIYTAEALNIPTVIDLIKNENISNGLS